MEKGAVEERGQGGGSREKVRAEEWERAPSTWKSGWWEPGEGGQEERGMPILWAAGSSFCRDGDGEQLSMGRAMSGR